MLLIVCDWPQVEWNVRQVVVNALDKMIANYTRQNLASVLDGGNDFSSTDMQLAYVFKYMISHCNVVRMVLSMCGRHFPSPELVHSVTETKILKVVSIGGGPGSEYLGLLAYLKDYSVTNCSVEVCLVDSCEGWFEIQQLAAAAARKSGWCAALVSSLQQNVLQPLSKELQEKLCKCNIITFVKVAQIKCSQIIVVLDLMNNSTLLSWTIIGLL